ncbi:MAG: sigma-70 family RNA polymerase sigma factor [Planctomycetota bacterium]
MRTDPSNSDAAPGPAVDPDELLSHSTWLRRLARALVRDDASADDLVQDAMGVAIATRVPVRDLRAFLAGTVRRLAVRGRRSDVRRDRRERARAADAAEASLPGADALAERVDVLRIVLEELRALPPAQQRIVSLRYLDDLDAAEIARREGTSPSTVRSHLARGLAALRARLDARAGGRSGWHAVLAPWVVPGAPLAPGPEGELPVPEPAAALPSAGASVTAAGAAAAGGALAMTLKTTAFTLVPLALAGAWLASRDRAPRIDATIARPAAAPEDDVELARVAARDSADTRETVAVAATPPGGNGPITTPSASAGAPERARIAGRVVDALTGEPVPFFDMTVVEAEPGPDGARRSVSVQTDAAGGFDESFEELRIGDVQVIELDAHGGLSGPPRTTTLAFPFEAPIEVRVGPTFFLDLDSIGLERWEPFQLRYDLAGRRYENRPLDADLRHGGVRPGDVPWVRFSARALELEGDGPWELELLHGGGLYRGRAQVTRRSGIEPRPVRFELDPCGSIHFRLEHEGASEIAASRVDVWPIEDPERVRRVFLSSHQTDGTSEGLYAFAEPGHYGWRFGIEGTGAEGQVEVFVGETASVVIGGASLGSTFESSVLIDATALEGLDPSRWTTFVVREEDPSTGFMTSPSRRESDPEGFYRVELKSLLDGRWVVGVHVEGGVDLEPGSVSVGPGDPPPTMVATPGGARVAVGVTAVDATSGARLRGVEAGFMASVNDAGEFRESAEGGLQPEELAADRETQIIVRAPGYRARSYPHRPDRDGVALEARLERGWANRVVVIAPATMEPVANVAVFVDGEERGRTNGRGELWLEGDGPPGSIEVGVGDPSIVVVSSSSDFGEIDPILGYVFGVAVR